MPQELPKRIERVPAPEPLKPGGESEGVTERPREAVGETPETAPITEVAPSVLPVAPSSTAPPPLPKDSVLVEIEQILAEGLDDLYREMPSEAQQKFRVEGEKTAGKIKQMMDSAKVKARAILKLIRDWLRVIPSVNRFFLEQESKIRTDKILAYTEKQKKEKA